VAIDDAVFLRSGETGGGEATDSFCVDVLRESHENGLVNFREGGGGAGRFVVAGTCGGGAKFATEGRMPESPCNEGFADLWGNAGLEPTFGGMGFEGFSSSSRLTLSSEVVERRWEVKRGELGCAESCPFCVSPFVSKSGTAGTGGCSESCGVLFIEEERCFVKDLDLSTVTVCAVSIAAVSFASSNVSCNRSDH
jgi:hypothetical protein